MTENTINLPPGWTRLRRASTFLASKELDSYIYAEVRFNPDTGQYDLSKYFADGLGIHRPHGSFPTAELAIVAGECL